MAYVEISALSPSINVSGFTAIKLVWHGYDAKLTWQQKNQQHLHMPSAKKYVAIPKNARIMDIEVFCVILQCHFFLKFPTGNGV